MGGNEIRVGKRSNAERGVRGNHETIRREIAVPSINDRIKHRFEKQSIAHPLRDNDVDLLNRQRDLFDFAAYTSVPAVSGATYLINRSRKGSYVITPPRPLS